LKNTKVIQNFDLLSSKGKGCENWDRCHDFLNIFAEKFSEKMAFLTQNKAKICKILIITLVFEKKDNFLATNWQTSQKIVIITSTPGWATFWAILKQTHLVGHPGSREFLLTSALSFHYSVKCLLWLSWSGLLSGWHTFCGKR
jgi:hypothetical protein